MSGNMAQIVVLARVGDRAPDYQSFGRVACIARCGNRVHVGSTSWAKVATGAWRPLCVECATADAQRGLWAEAEPLGPCGDL
jgi:hypothetical protein